MLIANVLVTMLPNFPGLEVLRDLGITMYMGLLLWGLAVVVLWKRPARRRVPRRRPARARARGRLTGGRIMPTRQGCLVPVASGSAGRSNAPFPSLAAAAGVVRHLHGPGRQRGGGLRHRVRVRRRPARAGLATGSRAIPTLARFAHANLAHLPLILQWELADAYGEPAGAKPLFRIHRHRQAEKYLDTYEVARRRGKSWTCTAGALRPSWRRASSPVGHAALSEARPADRGAAGPWRGALLSGVLPVVDAHTVALVGARSA